MFRNSHANVERNFKIRGLSTAHAQKDMTTTFNILLAYVKEKQLNVIQPARRAKHEIEDMLVRGMALITQEAKPVQDLADMAGSGQSKEGERENGDVDMSAPEVVDPDEDLWDLFGPVSAEDLSVEGIP